MLVWQGVRKAFGPVLAVDGLSLEVRPGEVFGLLGPNGAGKTTAVHLAVGLLVPDEGVVRVDGRDPRWGSARAHIGLAPQSLAIYEELTGEQNLRFFGRMYGLRGRHLAERVGWALDFVGLKERAGARVETYSGGMKRRLNLAIALLHDPPLLLLDEPTVGVDPQSRHAIFENIGALREAGRTVVYTTHYMEEAQRLCDRVGILDDGRLLDVDTVEGLISRHGGRTRIRAELRSGVVERVSDDPVRDLVDLQQSGELVSFQVMRPDLEAVFLNLTGRRLRD